ncbi:MAG: Mce-associated rane protein [Mycobacterium sp.]|nr:Mce-associated rane protein [Mycobacterium sp.]MDT5171539.1 Mce-associated rane protein [Mycobacterium sp.]MDT5309884.1 Mce-associated rane protein [Mycobacterium sp.]MDT5318537.1 Mce-associated rane protein [Mycobacterium sp.]MDT5357623.1 Mce-associated rane protein [Mycobacterium sp.]
MNAGVRQDAADEKPGRVNEKGTPSSAAQMRALAAQADAEAAEAEALAAAARARARALQLRQQADLVEATEADAAQTKGSAKSEVNGTQPDSEQQDMPAETGPTEEVIDDRVAEGGTDVRSRFASDAAADKPRWYRRWRRPRLVTLVASLAVIVIVASLAASAAIVLQHRDASQQRQRAAEFAAAAREGVVTLTSLDFNDAKAGVQRIIGNSTGSFRDDFAKMAGDFTRVVEESKVVERGTVQAVAVDLDSMTNDSAVVLIASTSEVTNAAGAKQDPRNFKLIVTLTRDGDQLKMSKVEFVS